MRLSFNFSFLAVLSIAALVLLTPLKEFLPFGGADKFEDEILLLKTEPVALVATHRLIVQVAVVDERYSILLGRDNVIAVGTVKLLYGVDVDKRDLAALDPEHQDVQTVILPEPEILMLELDEDSVEFIRKATVLNRLKDFSIDRQAEIRRQLKQAALEKVRLYGMLPPDDEIKAGVKKVLVALGWKSDLRFGNGAGS